MAKDKVLKLDPPTVLIATYTAQLVVPAGGTPEQVEAWVRALVSWNDSALPKLLGTSVQSSIMSREEWDRLRRQALTLS